MNWAENKFSVPRVASERETPSAIQIERYSHAATHEIKAAICASPSGFRHWPTRTETRWLPKRAICNCACSKSLRTKRDGRSPERPCRTRQFNDSLAVSPLKKARITSRWHPARLRALPAVFGITSGARHQDDADGPGVYPAERQKSIPDLSGQTKHPWPDASKFVPSEALNDAETIARRWAGETSSLNQPVDHILVWQVCACAMSRLFIGCQLLPNRKIARKITLKAFGGRIDDLIEQARSRVELLSIKVCAACVSFFPPGRARLRRAVESRPPRSHPGKSSCNHEKHEMGKTWNQRIIHPAGERAFACFLFSVFRISWFKLKI